MRRPNVLLALVPVLTLAAAAAAATPFGPTFGTSRFHTSIEDQAGVPDTDDYVARLVAGEKLSVTVKADRGSALLPRVTLIDPSGTGVVPTFVSKSGGKSVTLAGFAVPTSGLWAVRVDGNGTQGEYGAAFRIAPAHVAKSRQTVVLGTQTIVAFEGVDGALLDLTLKFADRNAPVQLASIETPHGSTVAVTPTGNRTTLTIHKLALNGGDGTYKLHLATLAPTADVNVTLRVTPQGRPHGGRPVELAAAEPRLDPIVTPLRGVGGAHIVLNGANFSAAEPPTVLFGTRPAFATSVVSGNAIDCIAPDVAEGTTVSVTIISKDGQIVVGEAYFYFIPKPTIFELVNAQEGIVHNGPRSGGQTLFLRGTGFETGQTVKFGTLSATVVDVPDPTRMQITVPASPTSGLVQIYLTDAFGRVAQANFSYLFN